MLWQEQVPELKWYEHVLISLKDEKMFYEEVHLHLSKFYVKVHVYAFICIYLWYLLYVDCLLAEISRNITVVISTIVPWLKMVEVVTGLDDHEETQEDGTLEHQGGAHDQWELARALFTG